MRVALCFSGQSRDWQKSIHTIQSKIIRDLDADVFIHTWSDVGNQVVHHEEETYYHNTKPLDKSFLEVLKPMDYLIENADYERFMKMKCPKINSKRYYNTRMMWYSIWKSNELKCEYENRMGFVYDLVIRCRFDLWIEKFDLNGFTNQNTIYLPPHQNINNPFIPPMIELMKEYGIRYMPNDQLGYGSSKMMDYYSSVFSEMEKNLCKYPAHPEGTLTHHLFLEKEMQFNVEVNPNILMKIMR